jgi:hypothetical protein
VAVPSSTSARDVSAHTCASSGARRCGRGLARAAAGCRQGAPGGSWLTGGSAGLLLLAVASAAAASAFVNSQSWIIFNPPPRNQLLPPAHLDAELLQVLHVQRVLLVEFDARACAGPKRVQRDSLALVGAGAAAAAVCGCSADPGRACSTQVDAHQGAAAAAALAFVQLSPERPFPGVDDDVDILVACARNGWEFTPCRAGVNGGGAGRAQLPARVGESLTESKSGAHRSTRPCP